jgi:hypothetical protein
MSTLEVLSYLTDSTFMTAVALTVCAFVALEFISRIGGSK